MNTELVIDACLLQAFVPEHPNDLGQSHPGLVSSVGKRLLVRLPKEKGPVIGIENLLNERAVEDELAPPAFGGFEVPVHLSNGSDLGDISHRTNIGLQLLSCVLA